MEAIATNLGTFKRIRYFRLLDGGVARAYLLDLRQDNMVHTPNIATFDLNLLRVLHVLLRERNVTRAAKELNVTQQAVSGSLRRLREHFNDPLLVRVGQHLEATPLALALVMPVRDAMRQIVLTIGSHPAGAALLFVSWS